MCQFAKDIIKKKIIKNYIYTYIIFIIYLFLNVMGFFGVFFLRK